MQVSGWKSRFKIDLVDIYVLTHGRFLNVLLRVMFFYGDVASERGSNIQRDEGENTDPLA